MFISGVWTPGTRFIFYLSFLCIFKFFLVVGRGQVTMKHAKKSLVKELWLLYYQSICKGSSERGPPYSLCVCVCVCVCVVRLMSLGLQRLKTRFRPSNQKPFLTPINICGPCLLSFWFSFDFTSINLFIIYSLFRYFYLFIHSCPVGWCYGIHRLHLCRGVRPPSRQRVS